MRNGITLMTNDYFSTEIDMMEMDYEKQLRRNQFGNAAFPLFPPSHLEDIWKVLMLLSSTISASK